MKIEFVEPKFKPVSVTFETLEELRHFVACMSISNNDRREAAHSNHFGLGEDAHGVSTSIWKSIYPLREIVQTASET